MKIDINKKYRYRMGEPVQILAVDLDGPLNGGKPQPVAAYDAKAHEVTFHHSDGRFDYGEANDSLDLIEVREPREWYLEPNDITCDGFYVTTEPGERPTIRVREIID